MKQETERMYSVFQKTFRPFHVLTSRGITIDKNSTLPIALEHMRKEKKDALGI